MRQGWLQEFQPNSLRCIIHPKPKPKSVSPISSSMICAGGLAILYGWWMPWIVELGWGDCNIAHGQKYQHFEILWMLLTIARMLIFCQLFRRNCKRIDLKYDQNQHLLALFYEVSLVVVVGHNM